ncbi:MAG: VanZ family protein [Verrucomicrobiales bacterium]
MNSQRKYFSWLPVIFWMGVIFFASTDAGSVKQTSRFIVPVLRWLNPEVTQETISLVQLIVRKGGHLFVYAMLASLIWLGFRHSQSNLRQWSWNEFPYIVLACFIYACTDEFHQSFVSTRYGSPMDVMIDTLGATLGLLLIWTTGKLAKFW